MATANIISAEDMMRVVETVRPFQLREVGSPRWLDVHEILVKLCKQSMSEIIMNSVEIVKDYIITCDKLKVLIHEAHCIRLWKIHVLPLLLEMCPSPKAPFPVYMALFHESICIALLDFCLFHSSSCEMLESSATDLVDYCVLAVSNLIQMISKGFHNSDAEGNVEEATLIDLEKQKQDLNFKIGMRCVSILNNMVSNINVLTVSAGYSMMVKHDVPALLVELLLCRPWQRDGPNGVQKFIDDQWINVTGDPSMELVKHEMEAWLCLHELLFNIHLMENYNMHNERRKHFYKCYDMLHDFILEAFPELVQLKDFIAFMNNPAPSDEARSLEDTEMYMVDADMPTISDMLIQQAECNGGYAKIAEVQKPIFLQHATDTIRDSADRMGAAYNIELADDLAFGLSFDCDIKPKQCSHCSAEAVERCAYCKNVYYCSRKCQLMAWPEHKHDCLQV